MGNNQHPHCLFCLKLWSEFLDAVAWPGDVFYFGNLWRGRIREVSLRRMHVQRLNFFALLWLICEVRNRRFFVECGQRIEPLNCTLAVKSIFP